MQTPAPEPTQEPAPEASQEPMRSIPDPGFAGDDGSVSEEVSTALAAYDADPERGYTNALAALQRSRLLVPVVAVLGEVEHDEAGLAHDKTSDMATVLMQGHDGRMALLCFTGAEPLRSWNLEGRPVPVAARDAARAAVQDKADALLVDVAGPVPFVIEGDDLRALAEGFVVADVGGRTAWVRPAD